jgi:hypothetical protein
VGLLAVAKLGAPRGLRDGRWRQRDCRGELQGAKSRIWKDPHSFKNVTRNAVGLEQYIHCFFKCYVSAADACRELLAG